MVTFLKENRPLSTAQRFAQAFRGAGEAIPEAIGSYLKEKEKADVAAAKRKAKIRPAIKTQLSLYDPHQAFKADPQNMAKLEELANKYSEEGLEADEAVNAAYQDLIDSLSSSSVEKEEQSPWKGDKRLLEKLGIATEDGLGSDIATGLKKGVRPLVQLADFPFSLAKRGSVSPRGYHGGDFDTLVDYYDKLTGGKGVPENVVERIAAGYPLGGAGIAASAVEEGLSQAGAPESVQETAGLITLLLSHRIKIPEVKDILSRSKKIAEKTGQTTEQVLANAQKDSGVDMSKIIEGDKESIRALKDRITETPSIAEKVKVTPKSTFNKKAALKERETFGAKLPNSPLEYHYEIEAKNLKKEAAKSPEIRAREQEIRERLEPEEKRLFQELRSKQEQLRRIEKERMNALTDMTKERLDVHYNFQVRSIIEDTEKLKDIQYQMKYGRARPTEAEIDTQIQNSIQKYEEGITHPTEKTLKDIKRQLELDKEYIDRAQKVLDKGELPGEVRPDTFIKMKNKYLDSYKTAIREAKETIKSLKGETDASSLRKIKEKEDLVDILNGRVKRLEADIVNQRDKMKALRALEKPSGAFYKNQLKSLKKDQALFKHDLFQNKIIKSELETKTEAAFKKISSEIKKGEELAKHPTAENIKEAAKETGKTESSIREHIENQKAKINEIESKVAKGKATPNDESKFIKWIKYVTAYQAGGFAVGVAKGLIEEAFDLNVDTRLLRSLATGPLSIAVGSTYAGTKWVKNLFIDRQVDILKEKRKNPVEWNNYLKEIEKSYGTKRADAVRRKALKS